MKSLKDMTEEERQEAIEQYAQHVVDDMDLDALMEAVKEQIEHRMRHESTFEEATEEIAESSYSHVLEGWINESE